MVIARHVRGFHRIGSTGEDEFIKCIAFDIVSFVDVGANVGDWTAKLLSFQPPVQNGWLYEPSPECVEALRSRFQGISNLSIRQKAVGKTSGSIPFFVESNQGKTSSVFQSVANDRSKRINVDIVRLDDEFDSCSTPEVSVVKTDTEGFDGLAIAGASGMIKQKRVSYFQFEYHGGWLSGRTSLAEIINLFEDSGYRVFVIRTDGLVDYDYQKFGEFFGYSNFAAVRTDKINQVSRLIIPRPVA